MGWGALSHDLALPGILARAISRRTGRGTDVEVLSAPGMAASNAIAALRAIDLLSYDSIVVTLGGTEALECRSIQKWSRDFEALLEFLAITSPSLQVFVLGVHSPVRVGRHDSALARLASDHRFALNSESARLIEARADVTYVPFDPNRLGDAGRTRMVRDFLVAAEALAAVMVPMLDRSFDSSGPSAGRRDAPTDKNEIARQRAVDSLNLVDTISEERYDRLVRFAREQFGTSFAALSIIDNDRLWHKSIVGAPGTEVARELSICATTILQPGSLIISDATKDARFADLPVVPGGVPVKFYAGFPIEAPGGQRVGALCVFDGEARDPRGVDQALLRDLALLVQREVWRGIPGVGASAGAHRVRALDLLLT